MTDRTDTQIRESLDALRAEFLRFRRVARIERIALSALLLLAGLPLVTPAGRSDGPSMPLRAAKQVTDVLQTRDLQILNASGAVVAQVSADVNDNGILQIMNAQGAVRAQAGVTGGGGFFGIGNDLGTGGAAVSVEESGAARLALTNSAGTTVITGTSDTDGAGVLETRTTDGASAWSSATPTTDSGLLGDLDNDGDVDFSDFITFARNFGKSVTG